MLKLPLRVIYIGTTVLLFITELLIALFVRDAFVRPYLGDMLVTVLICSFVRIFFPQKIKLLGLYVFLFALFIEICQYFNFVTLLGLGDILFLKILLGATFSVADILCYLIGCVFFYLLEKFALNNSLYKPNNNKQ